MNGNRYQLGRVARIRNLIMAAAPVLTGVLAAVSMASPASAAPLSRAGTAAASLSARTAVQVCGEGATLVRPSSIVLTCADHGMIAKHLRWSSWTRTRATATGIVTWRADSNHWDSTTANVTLTDAVHEPGKRILFTRLDLHMTGRTPPRFIRNVVFNEAPAAAASPLPSARAQSPGTRQSPLQFAAPSGTLGYAQIEGYWVDAGGPSGSDGSHTYAQVAAAITSCESSFRPGVIQPGEPYSTTGWGLWQITPGNSVPQYGTDFQILDPWNNAEEAVSKFDAAGGFTPWTTFVDGCYTTALQNTAADTELTDPGEYVQVNSAPSGTPSSPAADPGSTDGPLMPGLAAFQANTGDQWIYTPTNAGDRNTSLGMAKGTSPAVAPDGSGGFETAFQANTGDLWIYTPTNAGHRDTGLGMASGTSPAIADASSGPEVAFQANTGDLWLDTPTGNRNTGLGMAAGTSPAIAPDGGGFEVAFQANTGDLWLDTPTGNVDTGLGMASGTSPSVDADGEVAFQADTGDLWVYTPTNAGDRDTGLGMAAGTSPSIADGEVAAFHANNSDLWVYTPTNAGDRDTGLGMAAGTSPFITN
jgi:hypothetical protein